MFNFPDNFLMFIVAATIASAFPGVAVMGSFVIGLKHGLKDATIFSLGLVSASILYFILSGFGLVILISEYQTIFLIIKYLGIIYLFYLGIQSMRQDKLDLEWNDPNEKNRTAIGLFVSGFLIHLANPKNLLFFAALLPQYLNLEKPIVEQIFWLCIGSEIPEFILLLVYAYFARIIRPFLLRPSVSKWFNKIIGMLFIGLAFILIFH